MPFIFVYRTADIYIYAILRESAKISAGRYTNLNGIVALILYNCNKAFNLQVSHNIGAKNIFFVFYVGARMNECDIEFEFT